MSIADKFEVVADAVYEKGREAQNKEFWGKLQNYGNNARYQRTFYSDRWTDDVFDPVYTFKSTNMLNCFENSVLTSTKKPIDVTDSTGGTPLNSAFKNSKLKTIVELIVAEHIQFNSTFAGCSALVDIIFTGAIGQNLDLSDSPLLSEATLTNIVEHLAIVSVATTLTLHATAKKKLTNAQIATIDEKGWTLA